MKRLLSSFFLSYPGALVYMAQSSEYHAGPYLKWYWRVSDFSRVEHRRNLERTKVAKLLLLVLRLGMLAQIIAGAYLIWISVEKLDPALLAGGTVLIAFYPLIWAYLLVVPLVLGRKLIFEPKERKLIAQSKDIFAKHPATIIAVAGSYGKTTMKELLVTVLGEAKKVAATPGNKNVPSSHAVFAKNLAGDEEVLVIEYGESKPGDVAQFAATTQPDIGIITGIAPAHLDQYKTLEAVTQDIYSLADYLEDKKVFINAESIPTKNQQKPSHILYSAEGCDGWVVSNLELSVQGTSFVMTKDDQKLELHTGLLGMHQVGPLGAVVALASYLGLTKEQIEHGVNTTQPFEHRMQPRQLPGNVWIIDDTYNGNIEGMKAGLDLLAALPATRRVYVTPGLVDQGELHESVHQHLGSLIALRAPDLVVLMQNSATLFIQKGMEASGYKGKVMIEDDPLKFYTHIDQFVAGGDVVLMQNDLPDNYA